MTPAGAAPAMRGRRTARPGRRRLRSTRRMLRGALAVFIFLGVWQALVSAGRLDPLFASSPVAIVEALFRLLTNGSLAPDLAASGLEFVIGFSLGTGGGVILGILFGWFDLLDDMSDPFIAALYATPYVALLPIIILWAGIGLWSKVIIIVWATFFPTVINTIAGVKNTPSEFLRVADAFCVGRRRVLTTVVFPAAVPYVLAGLRQAVGRGLVGVIVAEFFIANKGIGFFIASTTAAFRTAAAFAAILITAVVGVVLVRLVALIEKRVASWRGGTTGA